MHACEIVAYVEDGAIMCPDCYTGPESEATGVVFAMDDESIIGDTCHDCGACYAPTGRLCGAEWQDRDSLTILVRWARCTSCHGCTPVARDDRHARLDARRNELICPDCRKPTLHF